MNLQAPQLAVPDKVIAPEDASAIADPLADALLYLAAHHGRSISREALLAGLPIIDGKLNASLLERAARKAGLEIEPVKRSLSDIPALVLPALLTMQDGTTRVLLEIDHELNKASVVDPAKGGAPETRTLAALDGRLSRLRLPGAAGRQCRRRARSRPARCCRPHWFWSVVIALRLQLQPCRDRRLPDQRAGARRAALHHERL